MTILNNPVANIRCALLEAYVIGFFLKIGFFNFKVCKTFNHQQQQSQQQQPQLICSISNVSNYNNSYCTQQGFMHQTTPTLLTYQNQMNYTNSNGSHGTINAPGPWVHHQSNYFSSFNNIDCSPNTYCIGSSTSYNTGPNGNYVENNWVEFIIFDWIFCIFHFKKYFKIDSNTRTRSFYKRD